ncbi:MULTISPECIES: carboxylating nicotinate-nucleotide diphosphorylase [Methanobacterium]|jgi:nicotinate-nucleotide pyrophosphorylase (carboxylating)|uniref:Nicotinate-nucleotide pyrophosphorylase [carboxylating] n=1 Tax=Methanobacterium veterum TaxID=408577 RepID=A0A9E4ZSA0_9EURY|nr:MULTISPECIES: carboxylating nicotinate-nucleotide diphosphorylase [Methanobacterium]MCZ3364777.1 carboxylating nicotinate-nucleotide diphosphorylase [Methanobacterium veterum]MCZ3372531.1 carboxylating nicotinate-nucleotide diphosphorylase [Methanobacterium veterum]
MRNILKQMVYEDIGFEDITSNALIPEDLETKGIIIAKEEGIISGIDVVSDLFDEFKIKSSAKKHDGDNVKVNDIIMDIKGNAQTVLSLERTALNFLMRMSGIATLTFNTLQKIREVNENIILAGTRKTTPGLQIFEKNAVKVGGGDTHRFRLDDSVLIKDNHIAIVGSIEEAVIMAKKNVSFTKKIEIEVESEKGAIDAAKAGADIVMLDNMNPREIDEVISALESMNLRDNILIEVSGGINPENIVEYAKTNADIISTGYITHSARSLDLSLEII